MDTDPTRRRELDDMDRGASRGLVVALILGAAVFLGLVVWFLRTGGAIWG